jgi:hypothetical protein
VDGYQVVEGPVVFHNENRDLIEAKQPLQVFGNLHAIIKEKSPKVFRVNPELSTGSC